MTEFHIEVYGAGRLLRKTNAVTASYAMGEAESYCKEYANYPDVFADVTLYPEIGQPIPYATVDLNDSEPVRFYHRSPANAGK